MYPIAVYQPAFGRPKLEKFHFPSVTETLSRGLRFGRLPFGLFGMRRVEHASLLGPRTAYLLQRLLGIGMVSRYLSCRT
jgi:hypothetical protein